VKKRPKHRTFWISLFFTETAENSPHTLKTNSIQPVFSTSPTQEKVKTAFEMPTQGYFHQFQLKIDYRKCTKF
jgi:hypothetical protein